MLNIRRALADDLDTVFRITQQTIRAVYPHYYPRGAVDYFAAHHSPEAIAADIAAGCVFLGEAESEAAGTVTVRGNEIARLFVLPVHQSRGYGAALFAYAEHIAAEQHATAVIDVSFAAKQFYLRRGYREIRYTALRTENGDYLCFDTMEKHLHNETEGDS